MPSSLPTIRASNKAILSSLASGKVGADVPTAVFVGGTAGIGRAMAERLAAHTDGNVNIVILGRNEVAARQILDSFPIPSTKPMREFIKVDLSQDVAGLTSVTSQLPSPIDFLVLTPGYLALDARTENKEGIDKKMAVNYYGRWKFIYDLTSRGKMREGGKILSVLAAGHGANIGKETVEDLGLKKPGAYGISRVAGLTPTYTDLALKTFSSLYPNLSFTQAYPGGVRTSIFSSSTSRSIRWASPLLYLAYPFTFSPAESAEYLWGGLLSVAKEPGAHRIGSKGEDLGNKNWYGTEEEEKRLWEHTKETVGVTKV
ncbi:hypothetical protein BDZ89DRAFT_960712 [Hymenopellis radicata]|nr:hypothetical protein BDZ89DRAFT_960712 [Hymenopellis radicata]